MAENNKDRNNIDQRLDRLTERHEALTQSIELTHRDIVELQEAIHAAQERQNKLDARERRGRIALLAGIQAYLEEMNRDDSAEGKES